MHSPVDADGGPVPVGQGTDRPPGCGKHAVDWPENRERDSAQNQKFIMLHFVRVPRILWIPLLPADYRREY